MNLQRRGICLSMISSNLNYSIHDVMPVASGEELKQHVERAVKVNESQATVVEKMIGCGCVQGDLVFVERLHTNHCVEIPAQKGV